MVCPLESAAEVSAASAPLAPFIGRTHAPFSQDHVRHLHKPPPTTKQAHTHTRIYKHLLHKQSLHARTATMPPTTTTRKLAKKGRQGPKKHQSAKKASTRAKSPWRDSLWPNRPIKYYPIVRRSVWRKKTGKTMLYMQASTLRKEEA